MGSSGLHPLKIDPVELTDGVVWSIPLISVERAFKEEQYVIAPWLMVDEVACQKTDSQTCL